MNTSTTDAGAEFIRLTSGRQSVSVRLLSTEPVLEDLGVRYYDAEIVISSDFVNATLPLGFDSNDLDEWGELLDATAEVDGEPDGEEPFAADWPRAGRSAYLRFIADDPYVIEVHDAPSTGIGVSVPVDMDEGWPAEAKERLAAVRALLGGARSALSPRHRAESLVHIDAVPGG
ncbi:DUF5959 family protein [Streptomyces sp. URMC 127]|uniref:DUF5959 family protein n=1 Tax=Streptomyces sp. URMC 127 TaxID=3423402 RepID=UPI003F1D7792